MGEGGEDREEARGSEGRRGKSIREGRGEKCKKERGKKGEEMLAELLTVVFFPPQVRVVEYAGVGVQVSGAQSFSASDSRFIFLIILVLKGVTY